MICLVYRYHICSKPIPTLWGNVKLIVKLGGSLIWTNRNLVVVSNMFHVQPYLAKQSKIRFSPTFCWWIIIQKHQELQTLCQTVCNTNQSSWKFQPTYENIPQVPQVLQIWKDFQIINRWGSGVCSCCMLLHFVLLVASTHDTLPFLRNRFGSQFQARSLELCLFVSKTLSRIETDDPVVGKRTERTAWFHRVTWRLMKLAEWDDAHLRNEGWKTT